MSDLQGILVLASGDLKLVVIGAIPEPSPARAFHSNAGSRKFVLEEKVDYTSGIEGEGRREEREKKRKEQRANKQNQKSV